MGLVPWSHPKCPYEQEATAGSEQPQLLTVTGSERSFSKMLLVCKA